LLLYAGHASRLQELSTSAAINARTTIIPTFFILPAFKSVTKIALFLKTIFVPNYYFDTQVFLNHQRVQLLFKKPMHNETSLI
jgi:hypothetical protein